MPVTPRMFLMSRFNYKSSIRFIINSSGARGPEMTTGRLSNKIQEQRIHQDKLDHNIFNSVIFACQLVLNASSTGAAFKIAKHGMPSSTLVA